MMNAKPTSKPIFVSRVMSHLAELPVAGGELPAAFNGNGRLTAGNSFNHTELGGTGSGVAAGFVVGGGDGLLGHDRNLPGLLRRPKRLLDAAVLARVEADHSESTVWMQVPRCVVQQCVQVLQLAVHVHAQSHERARRRIDLLGCSAPS